MLAEIRLHPDDTVVEVGPGLGALTDPLLKQLNQLIVVEIDRDLIARLTERQAENLLIVEADALSIDWQALKPDKHLRVLGNLPYNIGTPLLIKLLEQHHRIQDIHVMLQKEVVDRLSAVSSTRAYGRLSVLMQCAFKITPLFSVAPSAFDPPPKVESAVVRLQTRDNAPSLSQLQALQLATRLAFANKRKTLKNNLKGHLSLDDFVRMDIDPTKRAETLDVTSFLRLAKHLSPG